MTARLILAWRTHPWLSAALSLTLVLMLVFAVRAVMFALYWGDPAHRDQDIAGWMTPRYVAHSWHLPPDTLRPVLDLPGDGARGQTLEQIAAQRGEPLDSLIARIRAKIATHREADQ